jgi:glycerate dehydrogenase
VKIVVLDGYTANPGDLSWEPISRYGELTVYDRTPTDDIISRIGNAEIVLINKAPVTRETMQRCPDLRYIGVMATGYNSVADIDASREFGIIVTNIPAYSTDSVAQHCFALLFELCNHVGAHSDGAKKRWRTHIDFCFWDFPIIELAGKTVGIVGYGNIGRAVTRIALAFGMKPLVFKRFAQRGEREGIRFTDDMDELFAESDVISLHCPLTDENRGLISAESIAKMKGGVLIINTARGPLVSDEALADALASGKVGGAAVDVLSQEAPRDGNPLLDAPNCILTPHIAWASIESRTRLLAATGANIEAFLNGAPINVVNG